MAQHNQLATILDMVGLKADLRTKLYESLPHAWPQEVDRFLAALEALQVSESNLVIATLADVTDYMSRLIGGVDPKGRGLAAPPMLRDPASLALPAHELYRRFRRETHASLKRVERRRLVRGSQARRIANLVDDRIDERWTLARLATVTGWSRSHLDRVFRREMGMTVREYVARAKVRRAVDLIEGGDKIEDAMLTLGYRNKTSFYQLFRRYAGVGPGEIGRRPRATTVADDR